MYLNKLFNSINKYKSIVVLIGATMLLSFNSCGNSKTPMADAIVERDSMPVMQTRGMTTLVSDSGIIRYKVDADEWLIFDKKNPTYWAFEKGVYVEKFDSLFQIEASIKADTAYYYDKDKLWKLMSNVSIQNIKGEKFDTDLLYWNEKTEKVYSDAFVRIEQPDRIITGYGFDSNQQMTIYTIRNIQGVFYVEEQSLAVAPDSVPSNTVKTDTLELEQ